MSTLRWTAILSLFALFAVACGGGRPYVEQVGELYDLRDSVFTDTMRVDVEEIEDPNLRELRERSVELLTTCDRYSELAFEKWDKRDDDLAQEYARVGLIYYRAAENYARSAEARERLNNANADYQEQRRRRNEYDSAMRSETELITLMDTINVLFEQNAAIRREIEGIEERYQSESRAQYALGQALVLRTQAEGMSADRFAAEQFADANAVLARGQQHYEDEEYEEAYDVALQAMERYRMAIGDSEADYTAQQDSIMRDSENQAIFEEAQRAFGPELAFIDARGIIIVLANAFARNGSEIRDSGRDQLDQVVSLLREYDRREVLIEGHTQDRGAFDTNMALSQTRADEVQNYFLERAIRPSRLSTAGFGEESPRFDNRNEEGRSSNDRVEIVFIFE